MAKKVSTIGAYAQGLDLTFRHLNFFNPIQKLRLNHNRVHRWSCYFSVPVRIYWGRYCTAVYKILVFTVLKKNVQIADTASERDLGIVTRLACGALAGTVGQTVAYPFDVARRRMQVTSDHLHPLSVLCTLTLVLLLCAECSQHTYILPLSDCWFHQRKLSYGAILLGLSMSKQIVISRELWYVVIRWIFAAKLRSTISCMVHTVSSSQLNFPWTRTTRLQGLISKKAYPMK